MTAKKRETLDARLSGGSVCLAGRAVSYTLKKSDRAKNLRLKVDMENGLMVTVPEKYDRGSLERVLIEKQSWILDKLDYFAQQRENISALGLQPGKNVLYRGREYLVEVKTRNTAACAVEIEDGKMVVMLDEGSGNDSSAVLERWLKSMARLLINQRIRVINNILNLHFNRVAIRGQRTRWGSCSRLGNLNFNWRLVMAPLPVMDYVVILLHLVEPNHSKKFWGLVENVCPDYKSCREWLKKNGHRLKI
jgi:predicted metal-dependent hydrolase